MNSSDPNHWKKIATPALFARSASRGRWLMGRHHAALDRELVEVAAGRCKRLIVQMPPRHGKSELSSKYFPAWYASTFPKRKVILGSATEKLATNFSSQARDLVDEFGNWFGTELSKDKRSAAAWKTEQGGEVRSVGVGGSIFGFGAHLIIIDDYCGSIDQALSLAERDACHRWFQGSIRNRLEDEQSGAIVIVATRYHKDDLVGRLLKEQREGGDQWKLVRFTAIADHDDGKDSLGRLPGESLWPQKWSSQFLEREKSSLAISGYPWMWEALYQQEPPDIINTEFPSEYFADHIWFDDWPSPKDTVCKVIAIDPSLGKTDKSDYSAIILMALDIHGNYFIDADLQRRPSSKLVIDAIQHHIQFGPVAFGCEANGFQELLAGQFMAEARKQSVDPWFCSINNHLSKQVRVRSLTPLLHHQRFKFRRNSPGVNLLLEQFRGFPVHKHDDGPDGLEMAKRLMDQVIAGAIIDQPEETTVYT